MSSRGETWTTSAMPASTTATRLTSAGALSNLLLRRDDCQPDRGAAGFDHISYHGLFRLGAEALHRLRERQR